MSCASLKCAHKGGNSDQDFSCKELAIQTNVVYQGEELKDIAAKATAYDVFSLIKQIYQGIGKGRYKDYGFDHKVFDNLINIGFKTFLSVSFTDIL
jgi:hypothetical protein